MALPDRSREASYGAPIYFVTVSPDGYTADAVGRSDRTAPSGEVDAFVNDFLLGVGTFLVSRLMYEVMSVWDAGPGGTGSRHA